jgi:hypothetical protein
MPTTKEIQRAIEEICGPLAEVHYFDKNHPNAVVTEHPFAWLHIADYPNRREYAQKFSAIDGRYERGNIQWQALSDADHAEHEAEHEAEWDIDAQPIPDYVQATLDRAFTAFCMLV